jgi:hypothetical protein
VGVSHKESPIGCASPTFIFPEARFQQQPMRPVTDSSTSGRSTIANKSSLSETQRGDPCASFAFLRLL